ncbi:HAD family hydrolase [Georgenia wangjunii]|uniref:HAD family hydrolase n=1 Tax=Georgenia wangjunii TaxID=3117730 RepID=UPI002F261D1F
MDHGMHGEHGRRAAAFFDLDKTVIATSSTMAFSKPFYAGGLLSRGGVLRGLYAQLGYLAVGADHDQTERMKDRLANLVRGWDVALTEAIVAETLQERIGPVVYQEAIDLIDAHHAEGQDVVIVSASSEAVVRPIAAMLGADHVIASRLAAAEGRYTGELDYYAYGPAKAEAILDLAGRHGYDLAACSAYSDSVTDVPMLEAVGNPVAVNPDKALRREAVARGWEVRDFARPVPLRPRIDTRVSVGVVVTLTVATGALGWWLLRRRARAH